MKDTNKALAILRSARRRLNGSHGHTGSKFGGGYSPTYLSWKDMLSRTREKTTNQYEKYGGKGVSVCARWANSFENFLLDMGTRPNGKTLGRKDNNKNYGPGNCVWETKTQQNRNRTLPKKVQRLSLVSIRVHKPQKDNSSVGPSGRGNNRHCS